MFAALFPKRNQKNNIKMMWKKNIGMKNEMSLRKRGNGKNEGNEKRREWALVKRKGMRGNIPG